MKINFTKKEYRHLLDLITMGDWVVNSHRTRPETEPTHYHEIIQKIYSYTKEMDCEDLIHHEKSDNEFYATYEYEMESECREYINEFEEDTMWQQLASALGSRDAIKQHGQQALEKMQDEERIGCFLEAESVWAEEFETHGLERIVVSKE